MFCSDPKTTCNRRKTWLVDEWSKRCVPVLLCALPVCALKREALFVLLALPFFGRPWRLRFGVVSALFGKWQWSYGPSIWWFAWIPWCSCLRNICLMVQCVLDHHGDIENISKITQIWLMSTNIMISTCLWEIVHYPRDYPVEMSPQTSFKSILDFNDENSHV